MRKKIQLLPSGIPLVDQTWGGTIEYHNKKAEPAPSTSKVTKKYKSLADIEVAPELISYSNFYSLNDFNLILNNQIALFKSTGQIFTIISFRLDPEAERRGLLTSTQLQNAIRLSSDKKDKICVLSNKIVVLITKEDKNLVNNLIAKIKSNLPSKDEVYLNHVVEFISVYAVKVNEDIKNADDLFSQLLSDEPTENKFNFH